MIRINLLRDRKDPGQGLPAALGPRGRSAFTSGREVALAVVFLGLGGAILWFVLTRGGPPGGSGQAEGGPESVVMAESGAIAPDPMAAVSPGGEMAAAETTALEPSPVVEPESEPVSPEPQVTEPSPAPSPPLPSDPRRLAEVVSQIPPAGASSSQPRGVGPANTVEPGSAATLSRLSVSQESAALEIFVSLDHTPQYQMFRAEQPNRIVIDLSDTRHTIPREGRERSLSNPFVHAIRIAQYQLDPPRVRLVLDVESFPDVRILPQATGLLIRVSGGGQ